MVAMVVARIGYEPRIVGDDLGTDADIQLAALRLWHTGPFILGRGMAVAAARRRPAGAHGRCRARSCSPCCSSILEIRHYITGGDIYQPVSDLTEAALDVNAGLALTIGLERVRGRTGSIVHNVGALRDRGC